MADQLTLSRFKAGFRKKRREEKRRGFFIHAVLYLVVNILLIGAYFVFLPQYYWFLVPLVGWGIGLLSHYLFGYRRMTENIRKEEVRIEQAADEAPETRFEKQQAAEYMKQARS